MIATKNTLYIMILSRRILLFLLAVSLLLAAFHPLYAQRHPELNWRTIETEHFLVHYHQGSEMTAQRVAVIAEDIYPHVTGLYNYYPEEKFEFVIKDTDDYANGAAFFFDTKLEIWAENLDFILRGTHNWLLDVVTHEYAHMISLQTAIKTHRLAPVAWFQFFGYEEERRPDVVRGFPDALVSYPLSGITIPAWFAEGSAQFQTPTRRYDYRDSHREMILRDRVVTDNMLDLNAMGTFGKTSIGNESAYNQGFDFCRYLAETYGDTVMADLMRGASAWNTLNFDGVLKKVTGVEASQLYDDWKQSLQTSYDGRLQAIRANLQTGEALVSEGIGNIFPLVSPDGKRVAYTVTGSKPYFSQNRLIIEELESGKKTTVTGGVTASYSWAPDSKHLVFAQIRVTEHNNRFNDLFVYDLDAKKARRITRGMRSRHPDWSNDGKRISFVVGTDGLTHLFTLTFDDVESLKKDDSWQSVYFDLADHEMEGKDALPAGGDVEDTHRHSQYLGGSLTQLTRFKDGRQIYHPRWAPDDSYLVFDTSDKFARDIARIAPDGSDFRFLLDERHDERYPMFHPVSGNLIYASDKTGIFNIYERDLTSGETKSYTNVIGGAFMPSMAPDGELFYAQYIDQGYKLYRIKDASAVDPAHQAYIDNYADTVIPEIEDSKIGLQPALASSPYKRHYSKVTVMPRLLIDYGTVKPGLYFYSNEMLDKMSIFGGFDINRQRDYSAFGIFNIELLGWPFALELYNQTANIEDTYTSVPLNETADFDVQFNLFQGEFGTTLYWPGIPSELFSVDARFILSRYGARIKQTALNNLATGETKGILSALRYSYLRAEALSFLMRHRKVQRTLDSDINPRGRYVTLKYSYERNRFLDDFATDRVLDIEQFIDYNFNKLETNWEEYLSVPGTEDHSLTLRFQGGYIDSEVDSFFHFFSGGIVGLKGYPFYSVEGRHQAIGTATYRLPLLRNINKRILNLHFDKLFLGAFYQYGNAWSESGIDFDDFLSNAGVQLRLDTFSWYLFPTRIFFEAAYPFQEHFNQAVNYPQEWKFYFGVLFDFDLRLEKRPSFRRY